MQKIILKNSIVVILLFVLNSQWMIWNVSSLNVRTTLSTTRVNRVGPRRSQAWKSIHRQSFPSIILKSRLCCDNYNNNDVDVNSLAGGSRRDFISSVVLLSASSPAMLTIPRDASAVAATTDQSVLPETKKPFAPLEKLVPAVRVKVSIDKATNLTTSLVVATENSTTTTTTTTESMLKNRKQEGTIQQLEKLLLQPQNYVRSLQLQGVPAKPGDLYLQSYKPMKGDLPLQRLLIQNGDVQTWKQLKTVEKNQEKSNEIRAALNAYTDSLSFLSDSYLLNVDKKTRSNMVREDRLPDIKQVITSDMGLRYLYRNQVLTAMDDVKAELEYQLTLINNNSGISATVGNDGGKNTASSSSSSADWTELLDLLTIASKAMDRWLSLIDSADVKDAFAYVVAEEQ